MRKLKENVISYEKRATSPRGCFKLTAEMIRAARKKQKLSQKRLAQYFGYHGQYVANWEAGISVPPISILKRLSKILKIPILHVVELRAIEHKEKWLAELGVK